MHAQISQYKETKKESQEHISQCRYKTCMILTLKLKDNDSSILPVMHITQFCSNLNSKYKEVKRLK